MCACVCVCEMSCLWVLMEARSRRLVPGSGVTGIVELLNIDTGNCTSLFSKSLIHALLMNQAIIYIILILKYGLLHYLFISQDTWSFVFCKLKKIAIGLCGLDILEYCSCIYLFRLLVNKHQHFIGKRTVTYRKDHMEREK